MLVVKAETAPTKDTRGHKIRRFICLCDCGEEKIVQYHNLINGLTNSCGCTHFERKPRADLSGQRFGNLTVLYEAAKHVEIGGQKKRCWVCVCDCGNEKTVLQSNLVSPTGTRSCGCMLSRSGRLAKPSRDLKGNRYGHLVVVSQADPFYQKNGSHRYRWLCKCDCGNETVVAGDNLLSGHTRSCGCMRRNRLIKKQFGMLTVISKPIKGERLWTCRCICGNGIVVDQDDLFWGSVTSCGCQQKGISKIDLKGQRFGMLTVIRETTAATAPDGKTIRRWLCRCDCGHEVIVRQANLQKKITRSCGCLRSKKQKR